MWLGDRASQYRQLPAVKSCIYHVSFRQTTDPKTLLRDEYRLSPFRPSVHHLLTSSACVSSFFCSNSSLRGSAVHSHRRTSQTHFFLPYKTSFRTCALASSVGACSSAS
jgi:hypothetical protein